MEVYFTRFDGGSYDAQERIIYQLLDETKR